MKVIQKLLYVLLFYNIDIILFNLYLLKNTDEKFRLQDENFFEHKQDRFFIGKQSLEKSGVSSRGEEIDTFML